jgi:hypothetical protein
MFFETCPRCDEDGYQIFSNHAYCVGCNYSPDFDLGLKPSIIRKNYKLRLCEIFGGREICGDLLRIL